MGGVALPLDAVRQLSIMLVNATDVREPNCVLANPY